MGFLQTVKKTALKMVLSVLLTALLSAPVAFACSLVEGYFYQVTRLRGTIVGVEDHDSRHPVRWMRQQVTRGNVKLSVYSYRSSTPGASMGRPIKSTESDQDGKFDIGLLPDGHYSLIIDAPWGSQRFDVQIAPQKKATESVLIDVSPIYPDCKGGHEFLVSVE